MDNHTRSNIIQLRTEVQNFIDEWVKVRQTESPKEQIKAKTILMYRLDDYADSLILRKDKA